MAHRNFHRGGNISTHRLESIMETRTGILQMSRATWLFNLTQQNKETSPNGIIRGRPKMPGTDALTRKNNKSEVRTVIPRRKMILASDLAVNPSTTTSKIIRSHGLIMGIRNGLIRNQKKKLIASTTWPKNPSRSRPNLTS